MYDVQMLMGGTHQCRVSPDEYVFATINIYLDIINLVRGGDWMTDCRWGGCQAGGLRMGWFLVVRDACSDSSLAFPCRSSCTFCGS